MDKQKVSEGMLALVVGFLVLYFIFSHKVLLNVALVLGVIGVLSPYLSSFITRAWFKLGELISKVSSAVLLSIVFFIVVVPVAFIAKIFKRSDSLRLKHKPNQSVYHTRNHTYSGKDLENVW